MILDLLTFDPGYLCDSPEDYADHVVGLVERSWESGSDLVLLPEFTWMGLEPMVPRDPEDLTLHHAISDTFWHTLLPRIRPRLSLPEKAAVIGTVPFVDPETHRVFNRAPIFCSGQLSHQDKLHLTPWEKDFSPGGILYLWEFLGLRIAVIICLDIEIPEISSRLRSDGVDLILCPSATENILGVERVNRCASARAVELGCHVAVSHLTGKAQSELIDENIGRLAHYAPSQSAFRHGPRWSESEIYTEGLHSQRLIIEKRPLEVMRRMQIETNPSHLGKDLAGHFIIHQVES